MLDFLFPNAAQVKELQKKVEKAEEAKKTAEETLKIERQRHSDDIDGVRREARREIANAQDKNVDLNRLVKNLEADLDNATERREEEIAARVADVTYNATFEAEAAVEKEVDKLKADAARETAQAAQAQAEVKVLTKTVTDLRSDITAYQEFVKYVLTKLPTVDLSKFNVNVDVPAAEVKVVTEKTK